MRQSICYLILLPLLLTTPALAGSAYTPPPVTPGETVTPPAELLSSATALLADARARDAARVVVHLGDAMVTIDAGLDLSVPRKAQRLKWPEGADALAVVAALGRHTGGDWDVPPDADPKTFIAKVEFQYIEASLTDGQPWGRDPLVKEAICTYATPRYDPKAVKKAAAKLGVEGSSFLALTKPVEALATPADDAAVVARLEPGFLYAVDYDAGEPIGWSAFHLPKGGTGFVRTAAAEGDRPYVSGLCFGRSAAGTWEVVAQVATGL